MMAKRKKTKRSNVAEAASALHSSVVGAIRNPLIQDYFARLSYESYHVVNGSWAIFGRRRRDDAYDREIVTRETQRLNGTVYTLDTDWQKCLMSLPDVMLRQADPQLHDLVDTSGFLAFAYPLHDPVSGNEIRGISFGCATDRKGGDILQFTNWGPCPDSGVIFPSGQYWRRIGAGPLGSSMQLENACRLGMWFLTMASQKSACSKSTSRPSGLTARRKARKAKVKIRDIVVVQLPNRRGGGGQSKGGTADYSHRFLVSGHFRHQPYGPGRSQRKLVWIAPFVKGPADKPLVVKKRVAVLGRNAA